MSKLDVVVLSFTLAACGGSKTAPTLSQLSALPSGAQCAHGGVSVATGADKNGNGTLDPSEVSATQIVCQTLSSKLLSTSTPFGNGQNGCAYGGVLTAIGLDDGGGGGVANDGVLQAGEVTNNAVSCNLETPPAPPATLTPPDGPAGAFAIHARGGASPFAGAGEGGTVSIDIARAANQTGGDIKLFATGVADTACAVAAPPAFDGGSSPWTLAANTVLLVAAVVADLPPNGQYYSDLQGHVFQHNGAQGVAGIDTPVTGIEVPVAFSLTLNPAGDGQARLVLNHGFHLRGKLLAGANTEGVSLTALDYGSDAGSLVDLSSLPTVNGVALTVTAAKIDSRGDIHSVGGACADPTAAGRGGLVTLQATSSLVSSGAIDVRGGACLSGSVSAGKGGNASLTATFGQLCNSSTVNAAGGATTDPIAAIAPALALAPAIAQPRRGGDGGSINLFAGGVLVTNGGLSVPGGDGEGDNGGKGGTINVTVSSANPALGPALQMSGSVNADGGAGTVGAKGGAVFIQNFPVRTMTGAVGDLVLLGYGGGPTQAGIDTRGGDGFGSTTQARNGGGGDVSVVQSIEGSVVFVAKPRLVNALSFLPNSHTPTGAVINYVAIDTRGGTATGTSGQNGGGTVSLATPLLSDLPTLGQFVYNKGAINTSGGNGVTIAGPGGFVYLWSLSGTQNFGAITADGGTTVQSNGNGDTVISFYASAGDTTNSGAISGVGASSTGPSSQGERAAEVDIEGAHATNTAVVTLTGGSGVAPGQAGWGGAFVMFSTRGTSTQSGTVVVDGGAGANHALVSGAISLDITDPYYTSSVK